MTEVVSGFVAGEESRVDVFLREKVVELIN